MGELRSTGQRKADVLAALERNQDLWLATAGPGGEPHLIAVSAWWDGETIVVATTSGSRTAGNLDGGSGARLALGSPEDVVMVDVAVAESAQVSEAPELAAGFERAVGWNPAEAGPGWRFYRLRPVAIQAYRGYGELAGRQVMRGSRWLA